jgi:phosphoribosylglycinamide formyltransferase-1
VRVGALASGTGTILEAILAEDLAIDLVVADRRCRALELADRHGIASELVERRSFGPSFDRDAYSDEVVAALQKHDVDVVLMAGFGTVIPRAVTSFPGRMLNTHPALLPSFKGWHAVRDALAYGVKVTGCTVHVVTEEMDVGPILAQEAVPVLDGDTEETLHERIKDVERRLFPATIKSFLAELERTEGTSA